MQDPEDKKTTPENGAASSSGDKPKPVAPKVPATAPANRQDKADETGGGQKPDALKAAASTPEPEAKPAAGPDSGKTAESPAQAPKSVKLVGAKPNLKVTRSPFAAKMAGAGAEGADAPKPRPMGQAASEKKAPAKPAPKPRRVAEKEAAEQDRVSPGLLVLDAACAAVAIAMAVLLFMNMNP